MICALNCDTCLTLIFILDPKEQKEPREASYERLHALVPAGAEEDHREEPGRPQRGDLQEPRQEVALAPGLREAGVH